MKSVRARTPQAKAKTHGTRKPAEAASRPWVYVLGLLLVLYVAFQVYAPALDGPFLFDDTYLPFNLPRFTEGGLQTWIVGVRPLLMFSYWVNYQLSGLQTFSYHALNVLLHVVSAVLVLVIVRKILDWAGVNRERRALPAVFAASLFLLHPVQTESVAYIAGRSESLSVLFFLGAFAVFLYCRSSSLSWAAAFSALGLFVAAVLSKEHTVVLPALLLLTDYYWNPGFSWQGIRENWRLYALMGAAGAAGAAGVWWILRGAPSAGFGLKDFTWYQYLFTQCRALFVYVRLFLLPYGQTIDYDFAISRTILDHGAIFGLVSIVTVTGAAIYFRRQYPLASYGWLVFLVLMAPTSSFVPIRDPVAERRLYLSMIGLLFILLEFLRYAKADNRKLVVAGGAVLLATAVLSWQRNHVWSNAVRLWEDTVEKSPRKARAHFQLAFAYYRDGRCDKAISEYQTVARLEKPSVDLLVDWGLAYDCLNRGDQALIKLREAAALEPSAHVYSQIAMIYGKQGKWTEALEVLTTAERLNPFYPMIHIYRGQIRTSLGDFATAIADYRRALLYDPGNQEARAGLAMVEARMRGGR